MLFKTRKNISDKRGTTKMKREIYVCNCCKTEIPSIDLEFVTTQYKKYEYCLTCFVKIEKILEAKQ